mmetsp:Transcript_3725/g.8746  ORF Transcript_3725/g.8746 Transcript_3725/m.8746 type:complete len:246 (+) Transcript_3725:354-1091(+)
MEHRITRHPCRCASGRRLDERSFCWAVAQSAHGCQSNEGRHVKSRLSQRNRSGPQAPSPHERRVLLRRVHRLPGSHRGVRVPRRRHARRRPDRRGVRARSWPPRSRPGRAGAAAAAGAVGRVDARPVRCAGVPAQLRAEAPAPRCQARQPPPQRGRALEGGRLWAEQGQRPPEGCWHVPHDGKDRVDAIHGARSVSGQPPVRRESGHLLVRADHVVHGPGRAPLRPRPRPGGSREGLEQRPAAVV